MTMTLQAFWLLIAVEFLLAGWATFATLRWRHWREKAENDAAAARYYSALAANPPTVIFATESGLRQAVAVKREDDNVVPFPGRKPETPSGDH
jgi:hypothetical protein